MSRLGRRLQQECRCTSSTVNTLCCKVGDAANQLRIHTLQTDGLTQPRLISEENDDYFSVRRFIRPQNLNFDQSNICSVYKIVKKSLTRSHSSLQTARSAWPTYPIYNCRQIRAANLTLGKLNEEEPAHTWRHTRCDWLLTAQYSSTVEQEHTVFLRSREAFATKYQTWIQSNPVNQKISPHNVCVCVVQQGMPN